VKRFHLSPVTTLVVSLSLVVGILVSGLTDSVVPVAKAQTGSAETPRVAPVRSTIMVGNSGVAASRIIFKGVAIDGVPTDAVLEGGHIRLVNGVIISGESPVSENLVVSGVVSDNPLDTDGVIISGEIVGGSPDSLDGVIISGEIQKPEGVTVNSITAPTDAVVVTGGILEGDDVNVTDGIIISGTNITVTGATVSAGAR
jgi:hypothetical protein